MKIGRKKLSSLALILENDSDIIQEYTAGKTEIAATAFVRKYQKFVFSTALRFLQSYDDADDASQEVFIKALNNIHKFRGDSSLKTWLYRITSNVCNNMLRKKKFRNLFKNDEDESYFGLPDDKPLPDRVVDDELFQKNFINMLSKLPEKQRETFALRYFDDLSYEEISVMLGTTVGGLKANYFQAVKKLATLLKKQVD